MLSLFAQLEQVQLDCFVAKLICKTTYGELLKPDPVIFQLKHDRLPWGKANGEL